jgi:hypothetical protein
VQDNNAEENLAITVVREQCPEVRHVNVILSEVYKTTCKDVSKKRKSTMRRC